MVQPGDVIENPVNGERITFVRTSSQTGSEPTELDLEMRPDADLVAEHLHQNQEKRFEVLDGRLRLRCAGEESVLAVGDVAVVPPGARHAWGPADGKGVRVRVTFTPGAGIEEFFEEFFRLGREGRMNAKGMPPLLVSARLALTHEMYMPGPPVPLQRAVLRVLAGAGRLLHRG